jgi:hypothetical protein
MYNARERRRVVLGTLSASQDQVTAQTRRDLPKGGGRAQGAPRFSPYRSRLLQTRYDFVIRRRREPATPGGGCG